MKTNGSEPRSPLGADDTGRLLAAFADPDRLRLLGHLVAAPAIYGDLTILLACSKAQLSQHLSMLGSAGLIRVERGPTGERVALRRDRLAEIAALAQAPTPPAQPTFQGATAEDERILGSYLREGQLSTIPAQQKKLLIVLRYLVERFEHGRDYPEPEVNDLLRAAHPDFATLRRDLADFHLLARSGGIYRRVDRSAD